MFRGWAMAGFSLAILSIAFMGRAADAPSPAERGRIALLTRSFNPTIWSTNAYENVWRQWGLSTRPANFEEAFRERYGLPEAPYPNDGYPMGVRGSGGLLGKGLSTDCLVCHGGSIAGHGYVGLPNSCLDMQALYEDLARADARSGITPFTFSNVRGTTEAGAMAIFLYQLRQPDLNLRVTRQNLGLRDDLCEDPPAWWLLKKKKTMYHTGSSDSRSVRSIMQFMLSPLNPPSTIKKEETTFRDIQAYILSLEPPKYPFPVDSELAKRGEGVFRATCSRCHGTYGQDWTYPNKIVAIDIIGTDRNRFEGFKPESGQFYNQSWFAHEKSGWLGDEYPVMKTAGYQAPPLDGIWATAPYLHNGSVPTVYHLLNSKSRPRVFTRSFRTGAEDYDPVKLGWKIQDPEGNGNLSPFESRKIYDTTRPGRGNGGHTFGDDLTEEERMAVIEYLKTL
jgi:mono/diheme cytochrome c family protein